MTGRKIRKVRILMRIKTILLFLAMVLIPIVATADVDWSSEAVESVKKSGVMIGYEDGSFRPTQAATREELAVTLDRVIKIIEEDTGDVYIVQAEPKTNWIFGAVCAIFGVIVGLALGFIIGRKKIEVNPIVNIDMPEINPVINIEGVASSGAIGTHGDLTDANKQFVGLKEEKFKPHAASFKDDLTKGSESSIVIKEDRDSESVDSVGGDLDKLKDFQSKRGD